MISRGGEHLCLFFFFLSNLSSPRLIDHKKRPFPVLDRDLDVISRERERREGGVFGRLSRLELRRKGERKILIEGGNREETRENITKVSFARKVENLYPTPMFFGLRGGRRFSRF